MGKMYNECRNIVESCAQELDQDALECVSMSFLALYLMKGDYILKKLPNVLSNTKIVREDNKNVRLSIDFFGSEESTKLVNTLYIPKEIDTESYRQIVEGLIFNLINLLRFKGIDIKEGIVEVSQGIARKRLSADGRVSSFRGNLIEMAITSVVASNANDALREHLSEVYEEDIVTDHYAELVASSTKVYNIFAKIIMDFMQDDKFKFLVNESFEDLNDKKFAREYNRVMENDASYATLLRLFEHLSDAIRANNNDAITKNISLIYQEMNTFGGKSKQFRKV